MEVNKELRPEIAKVLASKIKILSMKIMHESDNIGENSYRELVSAYNSLKGVIQYMEIKE